MTGAWLTVAGARAEGEIDAPAPPMLVQNPFVARDNGSANISGRPQPRRGTLVYQNPFATNSTSPPMETPLRPGPASRWRSLVPLGEPSSVKTAILTTDLIEHSYSAWDELPPAENLRDRAARRNGDRLSLSTGFADPPDPIGFAPAPLAQPVWLTAGAEPVRPSPPIGRISFDQPVTSDPLSSPANNGLDVASAGADTLPIVISDYVDSAESFLAQAQQRAHTAQSVDELSTVTDLCGRGLNAEPPVELATSLRRLAAWARNRRGELLLDADRRQEAINDFQAAVSLDPACSLALHNRAVTLAEQNDFTAALRDFNRVIELNPGLAVAYRNRAELLAALGKLNDAVADYDRAIDAMPDDPGLYRARAYALQRLGDFERAQADLNRSMRLAPDDAEAFTQRGNLAAERGDFERALGDFQHALAIDPNSAEAHRSLAWLYATCPDERYRDSERALAAAQNATALSRPDDYLALETLAAAHANAGQFDRAVELQRRAIAAAPAEAIGAMRQRRSLYQRNRPFRSRTAPSHRQ